jgi:predicted phosphodiesterase
MRLLLISDTHGKLGIINELAAHVRADAVIHAGDFGFYDDGSYKRLSNRELRLQVVHSDLSRSDKEGILALSP